ncbi:uncharacterized protein LOC125824249 [Solanum verrucosum]|uniref:uncharacterized protein LOC125824249 n=1 Tax=Solanum verrucosum TaxID=315347 RepID=UPI0020D0D7CB|nr:uncharacterized protein LOC125824249 [Solanum verrucosum]
MANQGRHGELGLGLQEDNEKNNQDNVNNRENLNNQGAPPVVPARPVRDVAVPLIANVASSIRKPPPGGIPKYAKYVKKIVANKKRLTEYETVALTEECSSRIQNRLPKKLKDLGSFTMQITIRQSVHAWGLCDLEQAVGGGRKCVSTSRFLDFSGGFVVLDFEPDYEVPFILGCPLLATRRALIDVAVVQLTMRSHDKVEVFDVYRALKLPSSYEELSAITVVDHLVESQLVVPDDPLERVLVGHEVDGDTEPQDIETCLNLALVETHKRRVEPLDRELGPPPKSSIEESPKLELKTLPAHLRYAFLGANETLHVILSAELSEIQVDATLRILKQKKK